MIVNMGLSPSRQVSIRLHFTSCDISFSLTILLNGSNLLSFVQNHTPEMQLLALQVFLLHNSAFLFLKELPLPTTLAESATQFPPIWRVFWVPNEGNCFVSFSLGWISWTFGEFKINVTTKEIPPVSERELEFEISDEEQCTLKRKSWRCKESLAIRFNVLNLNLNFDLTQVRLNESKGHVRLDSISDEVMIVVSAAGGPILLLVLKFV